MYKWTAYDTSICNSLSSLHFMFEYLLFQSLLLTIPAPMVALQAMLAVPPLVGWNNRHHHVSTPRNLMFIDFRHQANDQLRGHLCPLVNLHCHTQENTVKGSQTLTLREQTECQ